VWADGVAEIVGVVIFIGGPAAYWVVVVRSAARRERAELRERARAVRAHYAAIEAAEDRAWDALWSTNTSGNSGNGGRAG
jgi:hypothetical protein